MTPSCNEARASFNLVKVAPCLLVCPASRVGAVPLRIINILVNRKAAQVLGSLEIIPFICLFFYEILEEFSIDLFGLIFRRILKRCYFFFD